MLILVHQSTNKEKKPVTPHSGPRCRPGHSSSPVTLQAATQRSTRTYLGGCSTTPIIHMLMTALHYPTIPTLPSSPVRTTSNSTPALSRGTSYPPRRSPSVCISNTYTSPSSSQESVWDGKQCRAPGHVSRPPMSLSQHSTSGAGFRTPPPHRLPPLLLLRACTAPLPLLIRVAQ